MEFSDYSDADFIKPQRVFPKLQAVNLPHGDGEHV